ncbi:substrate-binding periplasmic protein [Dongshaea marina]|uniref:substrate-binding periplasmic protein n=1 Tax=Dongshaea marina TaxID=2047966 RepID=UPI000D3E4944|nr:transporter substrate-binding domain-containing protein [Dongshaea marina]
MRLFALLISILFSQLLSAKPCELMVRVSQESKPFYWQVDGKWQGISVDQITAILHEIGCQPKFRVIPWKRALMEMEMGHVHLMTNLSLTDERKQYMYFIGPHLPEIMALIVRKDSDYRIHSMQDLKKLPAKVEIIRGASMVGSLMNY